MHSQAVVLAAANFSCLPQTLYTITQLHIVTKRNKQSSCSACRGQLLMFCTDPVHNYTLLPKEMHSQAVVLAAANIS